jgi:hypoxanthine phosphoribosyltransferase
MHTTPAAFSYDYVRVESVVSDYVPQWRRMGFDAIVAIARGGLVPAVMASTALGLPLLALAYERSSRQVSWFTAQTPPHDAHILLVEDIAGRGTTLQDCHAFLTSRGHKTHVFTLALDAESRLRPDFGPEIPPGWRAWFPWERESIAPAFAATNNRPDRPEYEYASWAIDLDGILLPDLPVDQYESDLAGTLAQRDKLPPNTLLPDRDLTTLTIITGRPERDRGRTQDWLDRHGFHGPLVMRDASRYTPAQTAQHKAQAIVARGHTHFIESDAIQALEIARQVTVARIFWWNGTTALSIYANEAPKLTLV